MIVKISRHVFGSHQGYRTLGASADLTAEEIAELESFAFGQTDDSAYLASLDREPAYWSRALSSGRRAVTRVLPGPVDDQGRQSLRFVTAIIHAADWLRALAGEDAPLLRVERVWAWTGEARIAREEITVSKPPRVRPTAEQRERILSLLALIETFSNADNVTIALAPREMTPDELAMVIALLPHWYRPRFSYAVRSLSEALPVQLNYLAPPASRGKSRRKIMQWTPARGLGGAKYASGLAHFWTPGEAPPWQFVENCKAFGRLMPTWETSDDARGTVIPAASDRPAVQKRAMPAIPRYLYWALLLVLVLATTGFVVDRTVRSRRHAEEVLTAAAAFLEAHADPRQLPASVSERHKLIDQVEQYAAQVDRLTERSRAQRQQDIGGRLRSWREVAGARDEEHLALDKLLSGFEGFCEPLGLGSQPTLEEIPGSEVRAAIRDWARRLEAAQAQAEDLAGPYPQRLDAGLARIARWRSELAAVIRKCRESLAELEQALSVAPPGQLTNDILAEWTDRQTELQRIDALLPADLAAEDSPPPENMDSIGVALTELRSAYSRVDGRAAIWAAWVTETQAKFAKYHQLARALFEQHALDIEPVRPMGLADGWRAAADCLNFIAKAQDLWPDEPDATMMKGAAHAWMREASSLALAHFWSEVDHAQTIWDAERKQHPDAGSNGLASSPPNPTPAMNVLERAMAYWQENQEVARGTSPTTADQIHVRAARLQSELLSAKDRYEAAMKPAATPAPQG